MLTQTIALIGIAPAFLMLIAHIVFDGSGRVRS